MAQTSGVWVIIFFTVTSLGFAITMIVLMARTHRPPGGWRQAAREYLAQLKQHRSDRKQGIIRPVDPALNAKPVDAHVEDLFSLDDGSADEAAYQEVADVRDVIHGLRQARENSHHTGHGKQRLTTSQGAVATPEARGPQKVTGSIPTPAELPSPDRAPRVAPPKIPPIVKAKPASADVRYPPAIPPGSGRPPALS